MISTVATAAIGGAFVLVPISAALAEGTGGQAAASTVSEAAQPSQGADAQVRKGELSAKLFGPELQRALTPEEAFVATVGQKFDLELVLRNEGDAPLQNVNVTDLTIPDAVTLVERSCGGEHHDEVFTPESTVTLNGNESIVCELTLMAKTPGVEPINFAALGNSEGKNSGGYFSFYIKVIEAPQPPIPDQPNQPDQPNKPDAPGKPDVNKPSQPNTQGNKASEGDSHAKSEISSAQRTSTTKLAKTGAASNAALSFVGVLVAAGAGAMMLRRKMAR